MKIVNIEVCNIEFCIGIVVTYLLKVLYTLYIKGRAAKDPKNKPIHIKPS
jgi:hypothetical protein